MPMSTAKTMPDTSTAEREHFTTSEIRKAERELLLAEEAQAAWQNATFDIVVGLSTLHTGLFAETVAVTKRGHAYVLPSESNVKTPDWKELPPVPGTKAREWYDANQSIKERIASLRRSIGQNTEDSDG